MFLDLPPDTCCTCYLCGRCSGWRGQLAVPAEAPSPHRSQLTPLCACLGPQTSTDDDDDDKYLQVSLGDGLLLHSELQVLHFPVKKVRLDQLERR